MFMFLSLLLGFGKKLVFDWCGSPWGEGQARGED